MPAYVSGNASSAEESRLRLMALVRHFDRDANGSRKSILELLERDPETFYAGAIEILKQLDDSRGSQFLIEMLVSHDLLLRALCDPAISKARAADLARSAARVNPRIDMVLARRLAAGVASTESPFVLDTGRVMEVLAEISTDTRILLRLMRHSSPYVRSKAVKLVGRDNGSVNWVRSRMAEPDPRIRANAVEALWGVDSAEARELLKTATRDCNNRVAGNALLALYRLGDCSVIPEILKMADRDSALFRSTAAWVMGETGDTRFSESLARFLREPGAALRARAMKSLGRIKEAMARSRQGPQWLATGVMLEQKPSRRLQLAVISKKGDRHLDVLPTQFQLFEDGSPVIQYRVIQRPPPDDLAVVFVLPRAGVAGSSPWTAGALNCLDWKRPSDLWAVETYIHSAAHDGGDSSAISPQYSESPELIAAALSTPEPRPGYTDLWRSVWSAVRPDQSQAPGNRHVIVFSDEPPERSPGDGLIAAVNGSRTLVQLICTSSNATLERFCRRTGASLKVAGTAEAVTHEIELAYLNLLARHEISYASAFAASMLKIRVNTPEGWAETSLPLVM